MPEMPEAQRVVAAGIGRIATRRFTPVSAGSGRVAVLVECRPVASSSALATAGGAVRWQEADGTLGAS
jgi:hypothetical protein